MVSFKEETFINAAAEQASLSKCLMMHGCVAVSGGKIIGKGHNHYRCKTKDKFVSNQCTCHAEIHALRDVYNNHCNSVGDKWYHSIKVAEEQ